MIDIADYPIYVSLFFKILQIPFLIIFMRIDNTPVNENPIHIPSVPPTEPIMEITSYIRYSSYTIVIEFDDPKLYPKPNVAYSSSVSPQGILLLLILGFQSTFTEPRYTYKTILQLKVIFVTKQNVSISHFFHI